MQTRQYFYDKQIRRYILQLIRLFSGFQIEVIRDNGTKGVIGYRNVPCIWGDMSRMGATLISSGTDNIMAVAPMMAINITGLTPDSDLRSSPYHEMTTHFVKKQLSEDGTKYIDKPAETYRVSQHMPAPYVLEFNLDIYCTNTTSKCELLEQILPLFNPGFEMQMNASPFDVGKYCNIQLENIAWSSRSQPQGTSTDLDIATLGFSVRSVFLNVPSKVRRSTIIKRIINNVSNLKSDDELLSTTLDSIITNKDIITSRVITPDGLYLEVNKIDSVYYGKVKDVEGTYHPWATVYNAHGRNPDEEIFIRMRRTEDYDDPSFDIYSRFKATDDPNTIILYPETDTFKVPTMPDIDKIVNPVKNTDALVNLPLGTRLLITAEITNDKWGVRAAAMSILEKNNRGWVVTFDPLTHNRSEEYVVNKTTGDQYSYDSHMWSPYLIATYTPSYWMFDVQSTHGP